MSETELLYKFRIIIIIIIIIIIARASHLVAYKAQQSRYVRWGKYNENTAPIYSKVHDFFVLKNDITWEAPRYHHGEERNFVLTFQYLKKETKHKTRKL